MFSSILRLTKPPPYANAVTALWVLRSTGTLLIVAAGMKVYGMAVHAGPVGDVFAGPMPSVSLVSCELLLGIWLLSGAQVVAAWCAAIAVFVAFAAVSIGFGWAGRPSCGCFGPAHVSPWLALGIDLFILSALGVIRPDLRPLVRAPRRFLLETVRLVGGPLLGAVLLLVLVGAVASLILGSPRAALARLRNERLSLTPAIVEAGTGRPGETRTAHVELHNWTDHPIAVLGGTNDCACWVTNDLPVTVPAGATRRIAVLVAFPPSAAVFRRTVVLITNDPSLSQVPLRIEGNCIEAPSAPFASLTE